MTTRETPPRRAIRNPQFRALMTERDRRKLVEADLDRRERVIAIFKPAAINEYHPAEIFGECYAQCEPPPHPLVRWWRRVVWGE